MKNLRISMLLIAMVTLSSACRKDEFPDDSPLASNRRTILVYLGTDNNFRTEAAEKIEQLRNSWNGTEDGNLLVYADTGGNPVLVHIYHTERRGSVADTIETYPAENSASPTTFARVLNRVRAYRPAGSYGLVLLSHATGWLPAEMSLPTPRLKSVILDTGTQEADNYMELADFAAAIPFGLDFIVFDACFMGAVEVCYELKDKADYIVASSAEVLSPGFVYAAMMQHLFAPEADLTAVARDFYEYWDRQSGDFRSATVSVVKTAELEMLAILAGNILRQNTEPDGLENIQTFGYGSQKIYFDLGDCLRKLSPEHSADIQAALDGCVLYKACTPEYYSAGTNRRQDIRTFCGLSVYTPQTAWAETNKAYGKLKWTAGRDPSTN